VDVPDSVGEASLRNAEVPREGQQHLRAQPVDPHPSALDGGTREPLGEPSPPRSALAPPPSTFGSRRRAPGSSGSPRRSRHAGPAAAPRSAQHREFHINGHSSDQPPRPIAPNPPAEPQTTPNPPTASPRNCPFIYNTRVGLRTLQTTFCTHALISECLVWLRACGDHALRHNKLL
jgi:hypothetical protein